MAKHRFIVVTVVVAIVCAGAAMMWWLKPSAQNALLAREDVSALSRRVASDPNEWRAQYWYGKRLAEAGSLPQAEAALRTALGLQPDYLPALNELGKVLFAQQRTEEAYQLLRMATGRDPKNVEARLTLAALYQAQGASQRAMDELDLVLKQEPRNPAALYQLGACQATVQQYSKAETTFRTALREAPDDTRTLVGLSRVLRSTGRLEEAEKLARKATELESENVDYLVALAQVLAQERPFDQKRKEALDLLGRARSLDANRIEVPRTASEILTDAGRWQEAIPELREVIRIAPDSTHAYFLLARAYRQLGQSAESRKAEAIFLTYSAYDRRVRGLRDQIAAESENANLWFTLAEVHAKAGYPDRAIGAYKSGLQRNPENSKAQKRLAELLRRSVGQ